MLNQSGNFGPSVCITDLENRVMLGVIILIY
jgi:hypothetical protein